MSIKLKVLGLALVAALAVSAVAAISASATGVGHFDSDVAHTTIHGEEEGDNNTFTDAILPEVTCEDVTFTGTTVSTTETEVTASAHYNECHTDAGVAHVAMNDCHYKMTILTHASTTFNPVHLVCPGATKHVTIRATNFAGSCTITIPEQTPSGGGVTYTTAGEVGSKHDITIDVAVTGISSTRHADGFGACLFAGTNTNGGALEGEVTVRGFDTDGNQVGITATGSTGA